MDNLDYIKTKIKDLVLTFIRNYNVNILQNFSNEEFEVLKNLIIKKTIKAMQLSQFRKMFS